MKPLLKTSGSKGLHVYVPIVRGPVQKAVWTFAKALAVELASRNPKLMTSEYRVAKRPKGRVLVDYNVEGVEIGEFRLDHVRDRIAARGDLWKPLLAARGRADLGTFVGRGDA